MPQSNAIFGAVALAFVIFITARGSLGKYLELLFGSDGQAMPGTKSSGVGDIMQQSADAASRATGLPNVAGQILSAPGALGQSMINRMMGW